jgi:co-chaperonin GroES (HSP10)
MKPLNKYIIVQDIDEEIVTDSGLLLSANDKEEMRYQKASVIKPGTEVTVIKEGDEIYYDKARCFTMLINKIARTIILERDVVVVL